MPRTNGSSSLSLSISTSITSSQSGFIDSLPASALLIRPLRAAAGIVQGSQGANCYRDQRPLPKIETGLRSISRTYIHTHSTVCAGHGHLKLCRFRRSAMAWCQRASRAGWRCKMHARMTGTTHLRIRNRVPRCIRCAGQGAHGNASRIMRAGGADASPWARRKPESASARHSCTLASTRRPQPSWCLAHAMIPATPASLRPSSSSNCRQLPAIGSGRSPGF